MEIGTIAKGLGALGLAAAGGTGVYLLHGTLSRRDTSPPISRYDEALIGFLEGGEDRDVVFEVKRMTGDNGEEELAVTDLDNLSNPLRIRARVVVGEGAESAAFKRGGAAADAEDLGEIKALGGGGWIWSCELELKRGEGADPSDVNGIEEGFGNRIFKGGDLGLFGALRKDVSTYKDAGASSTEWTKRELRDAKVNFIKRCGGARTSEMNGRLGGELRENLNDVLRSASSLEFVKNAGGGDNKLIPKSEGEFSEWFPNYTANTYKAVT